MKYLVVKRFAKKGIDKNFTLAKGSTCNEEDGIICYNGSKICYKTSQNAYDHFSRDDDNKAEERFALVNEIKEIIADYVARYNEDIAIIVNSEATEEEKAEEIASVTDKSLIAYDKIRGNVTLHNFLKVNDNIFTFNFYNAEIEDLELTKSLISNL